MFRSLPFAIFLLAVSCAGCSDSGRDPVAAPAAAPVASGSAPAPIPVAAAPDPLTPVLKAKVVKTFAPQLRYNAYHNDGNTARWNRHEDFFPMSVASFLGEVTSGQARVLVQGSDRDSPGVSEVRSTTDKAAFGIESFGPYPQDMVGDPPGSAPLYVHAVEDPTLRALAGDGSGQITVWVGYWVFYPMDRAEARVFGLSTGTLDLGGHRGDWEHVHYRLRLDLAPGGTLSGGTFEEAVYYAHGFGRRVDATQLEIAAGTHPVVYVSQGKHAAYPQAGEWKDHISAPSFLFEHTDFFRGNGVVIDGWTVPLIDLKDPAAAPAEFAPPALAAVRDNSRTPPVSDWSLFWGYWGPDRTSLAAGFGTTSVGIEFGSPRGPRFREELGLHDASGLSTWSDVKASSGPNLRIYADLGITISPAANPTPVRR